jgi:hypothetical protein
MLSQFASLHHHLQYNHYPPIIDGEQFALMAIEAVQQGRGDEPIDTGPDVPVPRRAPSAWAVVEAWHLGFYLEAEDE